MGSSRKLVGQGSSTQSHVLVKHAPLLFFESGVGGRGGTNNAEVPMPGDQSLNSTRRDLLCGTGALAVIAATPLRALAQTNNPAMMMIGIIGSGHIGGTIGTLWVKAGHPVLFSSRHPEALKELAAGLGPLA